MSSTLAFDTVNAFCRDNHAAFGPTGEGLLSGHKFAVKDVFELAGTRTGFGQPDWLRMHPPAEITAEPVARLLDAGAELIGRTISDELCYSLTGENAHYGVPLNSWNIDHLPGGSSSGSAAATSAGLVDFALGTDCGGSVRVPASYCGLLGIRTTHGRVSTHGLLRFAREFDCVGWFAREAAVFRDVGQVLLPEDDTSGAFKRVLVPTDAFARVDAAVAGALAPAVSAVCERIGAATDIALSEEGLDRWFETFRTIQAADIWTALGGWVTRTRPALGPGIRDRMAMASRVSVDALRAAERQRQRIRTRLDEVIGPDDVVVLPTTPRVAPPRGGAGLELETTYRARAMALLCSAGLAGLPQVSVPLAMMDGMPLGLSLLARQDTDRRLIELAGALCPEVPRPPHFLRQ